MTMFEPRRDEGQSGFQEYLEFATRFRPRAVRALAASGVRVLDAADVRHPEDRAFDKGSSADMILVPEGQLRAMGGQSSRLNELIARYLDAGGGVAPESVFVAAGSSVAWLRELVLFAVSRHYLRQQPGSPSVRPIVLTPRGSFKCGGQVPAHCGAELRYLETDPGRRWMLSVDTLERKIDSLADSPHAAVVAVIVETPTALGQVADDNMLADLGALALRHPDIMFVQDCYGRGIEHSGHPTPLIQTLGDFASAQLAAVVSFRRDWGRLSAISGISCATSPSHSIRYQLNLVSGNSAFRSVTLPSRIQAEMTRAGLSDRNALNRIHGFSRYLGEQYRIFRDLLRAALIGLEQPPISCLPMASGQFAFLFLDKTVAKSCGISSSRRFAEILLLSRACALAVTILDSMGLSQGDPVGVRLNLCVTEDADANHEYLAELTDRLRAFAEALGRGTEHYAAYHDQITEIGAGAA